MKDLKFRNVMKSDLPCIFDMINNGVRRLDKNTLKKSLFKEIFFNNLKNSDIFYLVAGNKKEIVAFASLHIQNLLHHCGKVAEIQEIYVKPQFRHKGIGGKLLQKLRKIAKTKRCVRFEVSSGIKDKNARKFYESHNMKKINFKYIEII